jgi:lipopolysaccharide transport system ATP-binding protein
MKPIIEVKSLSKAYTISHDQRAAYGSLRDDLVRSLQRPFRIGRSNGVEREEIWALRDVSFDVQPGENVGLIGRNGAGKSTLLKILSRIVNPTVGEAILRGRVASLLEVGTGFHQELNGRENIYLNGAVLGMGRSEIRRKLDEIVDFSGVAAFLDTPVKFYSSGMYMRLAFSVAAHIDTDVLLVDEVLAVGDAEFQGRCLGKMESMSREGRTVIFVSHNIGAISELCSRGIVLDRGHKIADLPIADAIAAYTREIASLADSEASVELQVDDASPCSILRLSLAAGDGTPTTSFTLDDAIALTVEYEVREPLPELQINLTLSRNMVDVFNSYDTDDEPLLPLRKPGRYRATHVVPPRFLKAGLYSVTVGAGQAHRCFQVDHDIGGFEIGEFTANTEKRGYRRDRSGVVVSPGTWIVEHIE